MMWQISQKNALIDHASLKTPHNGLSTLIDSGQDFSRV